MKHDWENTGFGDGNGNRWECLNCGKIHHINNTKPEDTDDCESFGQLPDSAPINSLAKEYNRLHNMSYYCIEDYDDSGCYTLKRLVEIDLQKHEVSFPHNRLSFHETYQLYMWLKQLLECAPDAIT